MITKLAGLRYQEAIILVIIGSSSCFKIFIATAITKFGLSTQTASGITMSLFLEDYLVFNPQFIDKILGKDVFGKMTEAIILIKRKI